MSNFVMLSTTILNMPDWLFWILVFLIGSGLVFWIVSYFVASFMVYDKTLRRKSKEQWSRNPSSLESKYLLMDGEGMKWFEANKQYKKDVHIVSSGLSLYGEYYDFGSDRCAVILSGRTESLRYGYYFAVPYAKNGYNVLVLDPRGHGLSDGEFNTVGFEESKDAIAWVKHIRDTFGISSFVFHGICIGAAAGMFALSSPDAPDCIHGIVTEGMFPNFGESMKNHMIEKRKPVFPTFTFVDMWMKHYTGHSMKYGPINVISGVRTPLLMLHSKEDLYSTPEYAEKLYSLSGSENKRLVWFPHGRHSMLRITDTELYDGSITEFLKTLPKIENNNAKEKTNVL